MPHIMIKLMPKPAPPAGPVPMANPRLQPQDPYVQAKMNQGPGFALKPPPVDTEYLNEIMGNVLPKPATIRKPGESLTTKVWNYTNAGVWLSAFVVFTLISFVIYCWYRQRERNQYWADVNIEFVDLVEEEDSGGDEIDESSVSSDDERDGGGFGVDTPLNPGSKPLSATAKKTAASQNFPLVPLASGGDQWSVCSGSEATQGDEPMFYPRREYYRYQFE